MSDPPRTLKVAVVGHTNTGKTSLMRTLMRDADFGEVSDRPATTRHVEGASLLVAGQPLIELYDTPGLEDSIALLDHLESLRADRRVENADVIRRFLEGDAAKSDGRFAQEAKALHQVLGSDIALYVVDARDRVLGKHRDELQILTYCARPIVPVLNFIESPDAQTSPWREHLAQVNLHAVAEFDTVVFDALGEQRLFEKMRVLLDRHHATINALIADRNQQRQRLIHASCMLVADMLIDVAALTITAPIEGKADAERAVSELQNLVRSREQRCVGQLLELHRFRPEDYRAGDVPLTDGRWGVDLFNPAAMRQFGVRSGGGAAAGALAGLTIDAMLGGMSLGAATALGAAIGATLGAGHLHGRRLVDRIRGRSELQCDVVTIRLLLARQASLIHALLHRGHASVKPIQLATPARGGSSKLTRAAAIHFPRHLPPEIDEARAHSRWSNVPATNAESSMTRAANDAARHIVVQRLAKTIELAIPAEQA